MKILIVEDELQLALSIKEYLSDEDYSCEIAHTYTEAIDKIISFQYDCILIDIMLPDGSGMKLVQELNLMQREDGVLIISAKNSLNDKVMGLKLGADDYLAKPFHLSELAARVYSIIRRKKFDKSNSIIQNEIEINVLSKEVRVHNQPLALTKKEYDLLLYLVSNRNRIVSKTALIEHLSGEFAEGFVNLDIIYAHIKNLRKKLHEAGSADYINTIHGMGYKWQIG